LIQIFVATNFTHKLKLSLKNHHCGYQAIPEGWPLPQPRGESELGFAKVTGLGPRSALILLGKKLFYVTCVQVARKEALVFFRNEHRS